MKKRGPGRPAGKQFPEYIAGNITPEHRDRVEEYCEGNECGVAAFLREAIAFFFSHSTK